MFNMKIARLFLFHSKFSLAFNSLFQILGAAFYILFWNRRGHDFYFCYQRVLVLRKTSWIVQPNLWLLARRRPSFYSRHTTSEIWAEMSIVAFAFLSHCFCITKHFHSIYRILLLPAKKSTKKINKNKWNAVAVAGAEPSVLSEASVEPKGRVNNYG